MHKALIFDQYITEYEEVISGAYKGNKSGKGIIDLIELDFSDINTKEKLENFSFVLDYDPVPIFQSFGTIQSNKSLLDPKCKWKKFSGRSLGTIDGLYSGLTIRMEKANRSFNVIGDMFYSPNQVIEPEQNSGSYLISGLFAEVPSDTVNVTQQVTNSFFSSASFTGYSSALGGLYAGTGSYLNKGPYTYIVMYKTPSYSKHTFQTGNYVEWSHEYEYSFTIIDSAYPLKRGILYTFDKDVKILDNFTEGKLAMKYTVPTLNKVYLMTGQNSLNLNATIDGIEIKSENYRIVNGKLTDETSDVSNTALYRYYLDRSISALVGEVDDMLNVLETGFVRLYKMSAVELRALSKRVYSDTFIEKLKNSLKDLFGTPTSYMLGLNIFPGVPTTSGTEHINMAWVDTGTTGAPLTEQKGTISFGSQRIQALYGDFMDYEPFVSVQLFLPYIGMVNLPVADVMGGDIGISYTIDYLSGACTAYVTNNTTAKLVGEYNGMCAVQVPYGGEDLKSMMTGIISVTTSLISTAASGAATVESVTSTASGKGVQAAISRAENRASMDLTNTSLNSINTIMTSIAPTVRQNQGLALGPSSYTASQRPRLYISRLKKESDNVNTQIGKPSGKIVKLSDLSGFNSFSKVHVNIPNATQAEKEHIEELLSSGVIL